MNTLPLASGNTVSSSHPAVFGPGSYNDLHNAVASGSITVHGYTPSDARNVFRIEDGCSDLLFDGVEWCAMWRPTWATKAKRARFTRCHWHHARQECCLIGFGEECVIEDSLLEYAGPAYGPPGYSDREHREASADHGIYFGSGGKRNTIKRTTIRHVSGAGLHLNWSDEEGMMQEQFHAEDVELLYCGSDGTHAFQPDATVDAAISNMLIAFPAVGPLAFYHDGQGPDYACKRWLLEKGTIYCPDAATNIHVSQGTEDITFRNYIIVMADDRLVADAERNDRWAAYIPTFEGCLIYTHSRAKHLTDDILRGNTVKDIGEAASMFPLAARGDFTPTDPDVPGYRDWRQEPTPTPEPVPTPPIDPLAAVRNALAALEEPLAAFYHHTERVKPKTLREALRADQKALVEGVGKAKAAAG